MRMHVSVIVPARNAARTLGDQLTALTAQANEAEIIVVDNRSTDGTAAVAARFASVRVVECERVGINAARNVGVSVSSGNCCVFCDADDIVGDGWLDAMAQSLNSYTLVGGLLEYQLLNRQLARAMRNGFATTELPKDRGVTYAVGATMGMRKSLWRELGGFDESFLLGGDEVDFAHRAHQAGHDAHLAPGALVSYRLKSCLGDVVRQRYQYAIGGAHVASLHYPPESAAQRRGRIVSWARELSRVKQLTTEVERWRYAATVANIAGSVVGWARYGRLC